MVWTMPWLDRRAGTVRSLGAAGTAGGEHLRAWFGAAWVVATARTRLWVPVAAIAAVLAVALPLRSQPTVDFVGDLYPRLRSHNCPACHNASGVASGTRLHFPVEGASPAAVAAFGRSLESLVDQTDADQSVLLLKPTNRIPHTGGALIEAGSEDERLLAAWIAYLTSDPASQEGPAASAPPRAAEPLRRLTHVQYDNTVRDLLGDRTRPARRFPAEDFVNGYTNQASAQAITPVLAETYSRAAEQLAENAFRFGDENELLPCDPEGATDRGCAEAFVRRFGGRAFRRPLSESEAGAFTDLLVEAAAAESDFTAGAEVAIEAFLQAPQFLFLLPQPAGSPLESYEAAYRLSYALWNTMPDRPLSAAAAEGRMLSRHGVEEQARRLLAGAAARETLDGFFAQWMRFDRLLNAVKDRNRFREYSGEVAESMAEESRRLFRHLVWGDLDFREFFAADYTFVDDFLTRVYAMPDPATAFGKTAYPLGAARGGILGHGTFLSQTGKPLQTSPTERGLFVREHFLCQTIPPPPPGVDASLPPLTIGARPMTVREMMEGLHASDAACASCHKLVDPIGYGFEHFNTIGAYRETEPVRVEPTPQQERQGLKAETHELAIDSAGYIAGIEDSAFRTPREAGLVLAASEVCHKCIVKQFFRYLFGRHETADDEVLIDRAYNQFKDSGFLIRELLVALLVSEEYLQVEWSD